MGINRAPYSSLVLMQSTPFYFYSSLHILQTLQNKLIKEKGPKIINSTTQL